MYIINIKEIYVSYFILILRIINRSISNIYIKIFKSFFYIFSTNILLNIKNLSNLYRLKI